MIIPSRSCFLKRQVNYLPRANQMDKWIKLNDIKYKFRIVRIRILWNVSIDSEKLL